MKKLALLIVAFMLSGCAPSLDLAQMRPMPSVVQQIPSNLMLEKSVTLGAVTVPETYSSSQVGTFDSAGFRSVLTDAFLLVNFMPRQGDEPKYKLDANLVELNIPQFGFAMDSDCTVSYKLTRLSDNQQVFAQTIKQGYHAPFGEALNAAMRARIASEKAVRENVTHAIRVLSNLSKSELEGK